MAKKEFRLANEYPYNRSGPVRWILSHLARYPHFPLAALLAAILNNVFYSSIQIYVGRAVDLLTAPGWAVEALLWLALTVAGFAAGQALTGLARNWAVEFVAQRIERDARDELYVSLLGKSQTFHNRQRVGDIMARATNDVRMINLMFAPGLMLILDSAMAVVVPIALIGRMRLELLLVPSIFLVLLALTVWEYNRRLKPVSFAIREQFGAMNAGLAEAISGIEVVKSNVQERFEWLKFTGDARKVRDYFVKQGEIQALYWPAFVFTVAWAGAFLHGVILWRAGTLTLGQAVAFLGLVGALRFPTFISIFTFNLVQLGVASAGRILETINTETELDENPAGYAAPIRGEVVFENVGFGYDQRPPGPPTAGGAPAVKSVDALPPELGGQGGPILCNISFTARPVETIAIVGQTGSGKSTLTRLINRIFDADQGCVRVDGVDVREWSLESLRSQISTIEQDPFLFSRTLRANIAFGSPDAT
ncbi:MAG: ABC transporter ATP-binding protein, partial [Chloroflexi bacterium]|nr:ABC transporter ATP-binding protein [Chloroflexota bacterium]